MNRLLSVQSLLDLKDRYHMFLVKPFVNESIFQKMISAFERFQEEELTQKHMKTVVEV